MDTSKRFVQLQGVNAVEQPVLRRKRPRERMIAFFQALPPMVGVLEACGASCHWARALGAMGHTAKGGVVDAGDKNARPQAFASGRDVGAWLGLTPIAKRSRGVMSAEPTGDPSTAGQTRRGRITRAGDETLRSLLAVGASAVIWQARRGAAKRPMPRLVGLLARQPPKRAAVALAHKMARIAWKLMASGEAYDINRAQPTPAAG